MNVKTDFIRIYTSQQKGTLENRFGQLRGFFPKKTDPGIVTSEQVKRVEELFNNRLFRKI